jgi:hypothetical protein
MIDGQKTIGKYFSTLLRGKQMYVLRKQTKLAMQVVSTCGLERESISLTLFATHLHIRIDSSVVEVSISPRHFP